MQFEKYFPELSEGQLVSLNRLSTLYEEWNEKINVISRKDIGNVNIRHILHSLSIGKFIRFRGGSKVMDLGTGGGLPGLPLAILMPDVHFHLIDRIGKKIRVARDISEQLGIENVSFQHGDSSECREEFDFVVSRAVMPQKELLKAIKKNIIKENKNSLPNGLITLKGGDLREELNGIEERCIIKELGEYFQEDFFESKRLVYTRMV